jgi:hypothetical protein
LFVIVSFDASRICVYFIFLYDSSDCGENFPVSIFVDLIIGAWGIGHWELNTDGA